MTYTPNPNFQGLIPSLTLPATPSLKALLPLVASA